MPDTPKNLTVSNVGKTSFNLIWDDGNTTTVNRTFIVCTSAYDVKIFALPSNGIIIETYNVTGLTTGNKYKVCVIVQSFNSNTTATCIDVFTCKYRKL